MISNKTRTGYSNSHELTASSETVVKSRIFLLDLVSKHSPDHNLFSALAWPLCLIPLPFLIHS